MKNDGLRLLFSLFSGIVGALLLFFLFDMPFFLAFILGLLAYVGVYFISAPKPEKVDLIALSIANGEELIQLYQEAKAKEEKIAYHVKEIEDVDIRESGNQLLGIVGNIIDLYKENLEDNQKKMKVISNANARVFIQSQLDEAIRPLAYYDKVEEWHISGEKKVKDKKLVLNTLDLLNKKFQEYLEAFLQGDDLLLESQNERLSSERQSKELFNLDDLEVFKHKE